MPASPKYSQNVRLCLQIASLLFAVGFLCFIVLGFRQAIHALCPYAIVCFGINKSVLMGIATAAFGLTIIFSLAILIHSMFYGRKFCGYLCPLGTFQEAIFALRSRKYRKKSRVPYLLEQRFAKFKYIVLAGTSLLSIAGFAYVFIRLCPIYALSMLPRLAVPGLVIFVLIAFAAMFLERFWCRYLCPFAALLNLAQKLGALFGIRRSKIRRNLERCVDCGVCSLYCPMNLNIAEEEYVQSENCIHCLVCAVKCPKPGTFCCQKEEL
jgi:polyferredoxin